MKKIEKDGNIKTFKVRLVAKGYTKITDIDYEVSFCPVAKIKSIKIIMAIATYYDYEIWKMCNTWLKIKYTRKKLKLVYFIQANI